MVLEDSNMVFCQPVKTSTRFFERLVPGQNAIRGIGAVITGAVVIYCNDFYLPAASTNKAVIIFCFPPVPVLGSKVPA